VVDKPETILDYLNREDVRGAMHVPLEVKAFTAIKNDLVYLPNFEGTGWIYEVFRKHGYQMLHIMGTSDGILSMSGMWKWLRAVGFKASSPWAPWLSDDGQLLGFSKEYDEFKLATIHG